ncbi:MAG: hypothetical protein O3C40_27885 [Planctomycetota bacterium]|nr:hypothetical protein [Planctomycetota bacterium]
METFLKSIGVSEEITADLEHVQLAFQRPVLLWLGLLLLIPVAYFIYIRHRDNLGTVPKRFRMVLSVLRVTILAVLIFVASGPYLKIDHQITKKPIFAVLFDASQSMKLPAGPFESDKELLEAARAAGYETGAGEIDAETRKALNRIDRAELARLAVRSADKSLLKPLQENYELRYYTFARRPTPLTFDPSSEEPAETADGGSSSRIGETIYHVLEEAAGQQVAGMLLLSDGQNTGGRSPSLAARAAADAGTPIFVVPLGSSERQKDVSVVDVYTSGLVAKGDTVSVHVTLESQGFDGRPVKVDLKDGEELLDSKEVVVRDSEHQHVELTFEAKVSGARYLTVDVPALEEEADELKANNTDTAFVRISDEKVKVLLIDGLPRWDFRFIKNAIRRDNGLGGRLEDQPDVLLETEWRRLPTEEQVIALPQTLEDLAAYHTIILGDASPEMLNAEFVELIGKAVRDRGVGLIVAAGTQSMPHRFTKSFRDLLPVKMKRNTGGIEAPVYNPFRMEISPDGVIHETMRLYDDPGRNQNVWGQMPPYYWCASAEQPAPAATVLAWNPNVEGSFGKTPLIAFHYAGEGKVMFVGTDSTWLWRQNVGDRFFYKFWGQAIRFVGRRDDSAGKQSYVEVRPVRAQPGEEAQIELMAFGADGAPIESPTTKLSLLAPGSRDTIELTADKNRKGRYTGKFTPESPGVHRFVYQPTGSGDPAEATIRVLIAPEEYRHPNLNRPTLELLASATGGKVMKLDGFSEIPDKLAGEAELKQLHHEATIWDNWLTLSLLVLVYSFDVGIRRMMGLS